VKKYSEYANLFDNTLTLEAFLNKPHFTKQEIDNAETFIPKYIADFVSCVDHQEGNGMKLIKIHLLNHFVDCIRLYGSAVNVNGAVGESHLKNKTKQPARRTKMRIVDMEYQTALKDYEQIVLEHGHREIINLRSVERNDVIETNRYGRRYILVEKDSNTTIKEITKKKRDGAVTDNWQGYLKVTDLIEYLRSLNLCYILLHTEANVCGCKIYGNPITSRQDWIEVEVDGDFFQVQCLIFFKLDHMLENEIATPLHAVSGPGTYAIVHFMGLDVFGELDNNMKLYGHSQKKFYQHKDCFLVWGWSKYTTEINRHIGNQENPLPILAVINLDQFK